VGLVNQIPLGVCLMEMEIPDVGIIV